MPPRQMGVLRRLGVFAAVILSVLASTLLLGASTPAASSRAAAPGEYYGAFAMVA